MKLRSLRLVVLLATVAFAGCGNDDGGGGGGGVAEEEILIGSTQPGGGQLVANFDFDNHIHLPLTACLGGSDEMCTGGTAVYSAADPGFVALEEDQDGLYVINPGTQLSIEITAIDAATSVRFEEDTLDAPGESAILGTTPEFHAHGEFQIVAPGGEEDVERHISFLIKSNSSAYTTSQVYTATLEPGEEDGHEHE